MYYLETVMNNPFYYYLFEEKSEYLTPTCSLNRAVIKKLPLCNIDDAIEGLTFQEIFSTKLVVDEIKALSKVYGVDVSSYEDYMLPRLLDEWLLSDDIRLKQLSSKVAVKFGNRLGLLLLSLRQGDKANREARADWDDEHWRYWAQLDTVIFVGGLASSMLGRKFKEQIHHIFDVAKEKPYNIMLFDNGTYIGVMGCAQRLMKDNTTSLVFDFGHTNLKRCIVSKGVGQIKEFTPLESVKSQYVHLKLGEGEDKWETALLLHKYLVKTIVDTYKEYADRYDFSNEILISIANYNAGGQLNPVRGGYAKLTELSNDYAKLLTEDLSGMLHHRIKVRLVHDGTANALYFSEIENAACISLGTAFGVGFTDIKIK